MKSRSSTLSSLAPGILLLLVAARAPADGPEGAGGGGRSAVTGPSVVGAGTRILTFTGVETTLPVAVVGPDMPVFARFSWDFEGDGVDDWTSPTTATATHCYSRPGRYTALFRALAEDGAVAAATTFKLLVREGEGTPRILPERHRHRSDGGRAARDASLLADWHLSAEEAEFLGLADPSSPPRELAGSGGSGCPEAAGDGTTRRHVLIVNGSGEARFWDDVRYAYQTFHDVLGVPEDDIHVFNYDGSDGKGGNPGNIIDGPASLAPLEVACAQIAASADADDLVAIWITDHGHGYCGAVDGWPTSPYFGYLDGVASVDPDDEKDIIERDFKLRALATGGDYTGDHGMATWVVYRRYKSQSETTYYRQKYVSHFTDTWVEGRGLVSDQDVYIEKLTDYLTCDGNKDGIIDTSLGEVMDCDRDGVVPYDASSGAFDEGDWGPIDAMDDDVRFVNTQVPYGFSSTYWILDVGLDDHLDIDLNHDPLNPESNGTDVDNAGLFDGVDVNDDKDQDDWVSIDETFNLYGPEVSDDELREMLEPIGARATVVFMEQCFSGGFIEDLSRPDRIIATACEEDTLSYGNRFLRNALSALSGIAYPESAGNLALADANRDGSVDMSEAFNFAAVNDYTSERPQYDDNGDGLPHPQPVPRDGDGRLGSRVSGQGYLRTFVRGDGNNDGSLDVSDAVTILLYLFSDLEILEMDAADADDDGTVDIRDGIEVLRHLFQAGPSLPCPFPERGIDTTP